MLASDSDNESEYDSDSSSSESGPFKQVWGNRDLRSVSSKFDFDTAPPENGEEFLLAVRNERNKIPTCVAADKSKIENIKKRKSAEQKPIKDAIKDDGSGTASSTETSSLAKQGTDINDQMGRLNLQESGEQNSSAASSKTDSQIREDVENLARFLPTSKWRANRNSQFQYIRTKLDLTRDMMLQGKFYVVPTFTKFERDRIYWLRYCFGTLDTAKMIEIKRARKVRAKEQYEATKKLKLASQSTVEHEIDKKGENYSESDSEDDSEVHIVSKADVEEMSANISTAAARAGEVKNGNEVSADTDDLMKISGGSLDELVVVHTPESNIEESLQRGIITNTDDSKLNAEVELKDSDSPVTQNTNDSTQLQDSNHPISLPDSGSLEVPQDAVSNKNDIVQPTIVEESVKEQPRAITEKAEETGEDDGHVSDDDFVDPTAELRKLHGHQPTVNLLISMPQRLLEYLTTLQLEWLKEFGLINRKQGNWIFALLSSLQVPFEPDVISDLRQLALQCVKLRDKAKEYIKWSEDPGSKGATSIFDPINEIVNDDDNFGPEDVVSSCNLFISIVVDYFVQKDLNKYLTLDGKDEF